MQGYLRKQEKSQANDLTLTPKSVSQSRPTVCDPVDYSPPGSFVHGILQTRYWSGLPFPPPGDLLDPEIEPGSPALQADSLPSEPPLYEKNWKKNKQNPKLDGASGKGTTYQCRMQETRVHFPGQENPLAKEMAIHSSILAWKVPRTEEPCRLQSTASQRVGHNWATEYRVEGRI